MSIETIEQIHENIDSYRTLLLVNTVENEIWWCVYIDESRLLELKKKLVKNPMLTFLKKTG